MNGLWAMDAVTMAQLGAVARDYSSGLGLPNGLSTFTYPMADTTPVTMSGSNVASLYTALRDMVYNISVQAAIMGLGGTPVWPDPQAAVIA